MTKKNVGLTYEDLLNRVNEYLPEEEVKRIEDCYSYILDKSSGVKRLTNDDLISHLLNVAYILTDIESDSTTICAGLLHESLNVLKIPKEEIESRFDKEIADLVESVSKINTLNFDLESNSSAAQRKILVGLCEDVRVIIIKLADRLHNMRTLWAFPEEDQKKKAHETLELLIPIAHRLGMNSYTSELEDLCLRYLKPEVYFDIVGKLNQTKAERDAAVNEMMNNVSELLNQEGIKHEIKGRAKSIYSIYKKLDKGRKFSDIYDLFALRVFVETKEECYKVLGIIHSKYKPVPKRFKDYIALPKSNLYQSLHTTVFGDLETPFEIQIRTYEMDEIAERGIASHWAYKENGSKVVKKNYMEEKLQFFRSIIELNNDETSDEEFLQSIKEDFHETIYVFTPKGDVVELPTGSTPIDFAYKVHSGVGDKMVGAIVNNNIVPLDYELQNDDIIKINTNKNSVGPSREWINMAKTSQAKNKIKNYFRKIDKEEYQENGKDILEKELRKRKIPYNDFMENHLEECLKNLKINSIEELYIGLGNNKINIEHLFENNNETKEELLLKKVQGSAINIKNDIIVDGIDDIKVTLAACCKPIPGDDIIGYITKGSGITVHRMMCPNVSELEERTIGVRWNYLEGKKYSANVIIRTLKKENMLLDIVSKTSNNNINVQSVNTYNNNDETIFDFMLLVESKEKLDKYMNDIKMIPNVLEVIRKIK